MLSKSLLTPPLFLTDNIKLDGMPNKIKWKMQACFILYFKFWKSTSVKSYKIQLPVFLSIVLKLFRTSLKEPSIKDVCTLGGRKVRQKWTNADWGRVVVSQMWTSAWKKNYSYHICEIYSDNLAICLYIKFSFCLYSIENVWNAM